MTCSNTKSSWEMVEIRWAYRRMFWNDWIKGC